MGGIFKLTMFRFIIPSVVCLFLMQPWTDAASEQPSFGETDVTRSGKMDAATVEQAITKLRDRDFIADAELWIAQAQPKKFINSDQLRAVVIAVANSMERAETVEEAMDVLAKRKILMNTEKWKSDLQKPRIAGNVAALLLITLSQKIE